MALDIVIMAAGKGTRMKSGLPKVLHQLAGQSLLQHVVQTTAQLQADQVLIITGHGAQQVESSFQDPTLHFVRQLPQLGTGHAVLQALPALNDDGVTLILNGDVPLIKACTLRTLVQACAGQHLALLSVSLGDPTGYGRILRDPSGNVCGIIEQADASLEQREIHEVYTGFMAAPTRLLKQWLQAITPHNAQGEYYLTDVVELAVAQAQTVVCTQASSEIEVLGVNSPSQLADLERRVQRHQAHVLMDAGVRLADPARLDIRGALHCGSDVEIDVNCVFEGEVHLGHRVRVGAHCVIKQARLGDDTVIHPFTHIDGERAGVSVGSHASVGPFARLRPGASLGQGVHIGNFVEIKNATLGAGSKANHLAYVGDATVGARVNFGAGSITANYDGANKHRTLIGHDVHVGSNCVLVAPVALGDGATIGAGTTLSKDAPAGQLTVARARQVSFKAWVRPKKAYTPQS